MPLLELTPHPEHPGAPVERLTVEPVIENTHLSLNYRLLGGLDALAIPAACAALRIDGLWRATCFEAFLMPDPHSGAYYEFNFSPSQAWAVYHFSSYRQGMAAVEFGPAPRIRTEFGADGLRLQADVDLACGFEFGDGALMAFSAVVQLQTGGLSYWAFAHPPGKADFHHPASFAYSPAGLRRRVCTMA